MIRQYGHRAFISFTLSFKFLTWITLLIEVTQVICYFYFTGNWKSKKWFRSPEEGLLDESEGHIWSPLYLEMVFSFQHTKVCLFQTIFTLCLTKDLQGMVYQVDQDNYKKSFYVLFYFYIFVFCIVIVCYLCCHCIMLNECVSP